LNSTDNDFSRNFFHDYSRKDAKFSFLTARIPTENHLFSLLCALASLREPPATRIVKPREHCHGSAGASLSRRNMTLQTVCKAVGRLFTAEVSSILSSCKTYPSKSPGPISKKSEKSFRNFLCGKELEFFCPVKKRSFSACGAA
jgi:hypothetical protein